MHLFFFLKLEPDKFLKEVHERVCMNSPCKSKELHSQPWSPFQSYVPKPDCLWNPPRALRLLGSVNTCHWTGKRFGNRRKVVFQILKCLWGWHWFGPKASGLLWWVLREGSQVETSVQEMYSKDVEVRASIGGMQTPGNLLVCRAQYWGLKQQLGGCPTKKPSQLDNI